jgi:hypothetical protein
MFEGVNPWVPYVQNNVLFIQEEWGEFERMSLGQFSVDKKRIYPRGFGNTRGPKIPAKLLQKTNSKKEMDILNPQTEPGVSNQYIYILSSSLNSFLGLMFHQYNLQLKNSRVPSQRQTNLVQEHCL